MPIRCVCPGCGQKLKAKDKMAGRVVTCPACSGYVLVSRSAERVTVHFEDDVSAQETVGTISSTVLSRKLPDSGTNVRRLLTLRGALLVKEFSEIETILCERGNNIAVATIVVARLVGPNHAERTFGVTLQQMDESRAFVAHGFLDHDEVDDLINALGVINAMAAKLADNPRDHTEVTYVTRDGITIGLCKDCDTNGRRRTAFVQIEGQREPAFMLVERLEILWSALKEAREHLVDVEASFDDR